MPPHSLRLSASCKVVSAQLLALLEGPQPALGTAGAWTPQMPSNRGQPTRQPGERRGRQQPSLSRRKVGPAGGGASGGEGAAAKAMTISDLPNSLFGTVLARLGRKR